VARLSGARAAGLWRGKSYTIGEIHIFHLRDGKVAEQWHQFDSAGLMGQLTAQESC